MKETSSAMLILGIGLFLYPFDRVKGCDISACGQASFEKPNSFSDIDTACGSQVRDCIEGIRDSCTDQAKKTLLGVALDSFDDMCNANTRAVLEKTGQCLTSNSDNVQAGLQSCPQPDSTPTNVEDACRVLGRQRTCTRNVINKQCGKDSADLFDRIFTKHVDAFLEQSGRTDLECNAGIATSPSFFLLTMAGMLCLIRKYF